MAKIKLSEDTLLANKILGGFMKLNFLISISSETESLYGVRFLCSFIGSNKDCNVTLFHISIPKDRSQAALMSMWESPNGAAEVEISSSTRKALNQAKRILESNKIVDDQIKTKTVKEQYGKVKDILLEGANGLYDSMILGRRATYALQWMFDRPADEIPLAMIREASLSSPLWVCSEPEEGRKNVLLCLDGSTSALRVADHVGYILSFIPQHEITLFHVASPLSNMSKEIFADGEDILIKHGIDKKRIKKKVTKGLSITNAIMSEKINGRYAAIAVGFRGKSNDKNPNVNNSVGKTTTSLISKISKASLWCCP